MGYATEAVKAIKADLIGHLKSNIELICSIVGEDENGSFKDGLYTNASTWGRTPEVWVSSGETRFIVSISIEPPQSKWAGRILTKTDEGEDYWVDSFSVEEIADICEVIVDAIDSVRRGGE